MTEIRFTQQAPDHTVFEAGCFDHQIGNPVPFKLGDDHVLAVLVHADVMPDGTKVLITLDIPGYDFSLSGDLFSLALAEEDS
jgi:hypothetical protein